MDRVTTLYRFFDVEDRLLYLGITSVGPSRWGSHERHRAWWTEVVRSTAEHYPTRQTALDAEVAAIKAERPLHNTIHTGTRTPKTAPIYRAHGQGSVIYRSDRSRWAAVTPTPPGGRRGWYHFRTEAQARAFLAAYISGADDREVRQALILALGRVA